MLTVVRWKELSLPSVGRRNNGPQRYPNSDWNLNVTLYVKCDFADMMRFSWIMPRDPKCDHKCPYKRKAEGSLTVEKKTM